MKTHIDTIGRFARVARGVSRLLRRLRRAFALVVVLSWAGVDARFSPQKRRRQAWMRAIAWAIGLRVKVRGVAPMTRAMWVASPVSWLDVVALGTVAPVRFVSGETVVDWPFFRRSDADGAAPSSSNIVAACALALSRGQPVVVFGDGSDNEADCTVFRPRFFQAARLSGVPVQPWRIRYRTEAACAQTAGTAAMLRHLWMVLGERRTVVEVYASAPFGSGHYSPAKLASLARERCHEPVTHSSYHRQQVTAHSASP